METNYNIFISYRGNGSGGLLGKEIYTDLRHCKNEYEEINIVPFFAPACIQKGSDFKKTICQVLQNVSCVILILSPGFFEKCSEEDDMVHYELKEALKNSHMSFIPIVMEGFVFDREIACIRDMFTTGEIDRFRHINAINHHGVYDFNTEEDVLPAVREALESKNQTASTSHNVAFDLSKFRVSAGKKIEFGRYPQSLLRDEDLVHSIYEGLATKETIKKENRYEYNGKTYYNICENRFNRRVFESERLIGSYNFHCVEPIRWTEIFENEKYSVLISDCIIDAVMFNLDRNPHRTEISSCLKLANDWEVSYIRRWLNSEFYYAAFNEKERNHIQLSAISNGEESCYEAFRQSKPVTNDKVFLISHQEAYLCGNGCAQVSDYAHAKGAYSSTSATCDKFGDWWTRSPGNIDCSVENVDRRGCLDAVPFCNYVNDTAAGVRPCIIVDKGAFNDRD